MAFAQTVTDTASAADPVGRVVVVGSGPAGVAFAEQLCRHDPERPIVLLGDEPYRPYDRVRLTSLLARELEPNALYAGMRLEQRRNVEVLAKHRIVRIDRAARIVHDARGNAFPYAALVLATGSRPRVPDIAGIDLPGVYVFRSMSDAERLLARQVASRATVVIGGGLLGLEAARAMRRFNTRVHVVEHESRLMFHQLDQEGAALLGRHVERLGIRVRVGAQVRRIVGSLRAEGVLLRDGNVIACDTIIVATGIVPNVELARNAGIAVGRGIRVDDRMRTSDPSVYAIGECCEHRDVVYGLVAPGLEQAAVAAGNVAGVDARYAGSILASSLKVVGCPVFSIGDVGDSAKPYRAYTYRSAERYRRINVHRGRVIGAVAVGAAGDGGADFSRLRAVGTEGRRIWPWQLARFARCGELWNDGGNDVGSWPAAAVVCTCRGVTRGALAEAVAAGAATAESIAASTGASTVCGSCRPLVDRLLGAGARAAPTLPRTLLAGGVAAAAVALAASIVSVPYQDSVGGGATGVTWRWDVVWRESLYRQISGFSLLALAALVSTLSLRKRIRRFTWLAFPSWQLAHVLAGLAAVLVLLVHTGFRAGANLNFALTFCFTGAVLTGGLAGAATALARRFDGGPPRTLRRAALAAHVLLLWPLPVLLGFHVLTGYYF
ncbi:MAG: NAD(P)/FAD-dependent oxidoreductase [Gammaproteobacteria bacterium]|nr:NAD(P)/FAD-dependent oxidoreductase [Gammaproteobacteria bacterium]